MNPKKPLDGQSQEDIGTEKDIAVDMLRIANEFLRDAQVLMTIKSYRSVANRAYYAIFKAISAVHALEGNYFKKHKQAIGLFNRDYIHQGIFPEEWGAKLGEAQALRRTGDYDDLRTVDEEDAKSVLNFAEEMLPVVQRYCEQCMKKKK